MTAHGQLPAIAMVTLIMVWEDKRTRPMQIYMRVRNANGSCENDEKVSFEQSIYSYDHNGHPSICVLENNDTTKLFVAYVEEWAPVNEYRELKGSINNGVEWGIPSVHISYNGGYELPFGSGGSWSTNLVVGADNSVYAFWIYYISSTCYRLYFNFTTGSWTPSNETLLYIDTETTHHSIHMNPCADPDTNIHLVYADKNGDDPYEIYYLCKGPSDNNFGNYPGTLVSSDSDSSLYNSEYPSCAYSVYNDTAYIHVVWSTNQLKFVHYRRLNLNTNTWTDIDSISPYGDEPTRPSITVDSFNDVHVVWQNGNDYSDYTTRYRKYTASTGCSRERQKIWFARYSSGCVRQSASSNDRFKNWIYPSK